MSKNIPVPENNAWRGDPIPFSPSYHPLTSDVNAKESVMAFTPTFVAHFNRVLVEILVERYADKVTAKEVMDKLTEEEKDRVS